MADGLRYTGCWPPPELLDAYPNWVYALDEECEPGQDETTLKPEGQQSSISDETEFTAAVATLANGRAVPAGISFLNGYVERVIVWNGEDWWAVRCDAAQEEWTPGFEAGLREGERGASISLSDSAVFPARIATRLPDLDGTHREITIPLRSDAASRHTKPWYRLWQAKLRGKPDGK